MINGLRIQYFFKLTQLVCSKFNFKTGKSRFDTLILAKKYGKDFVLWY